MNHERERDGEDGNKRKTENNCGGRRGEEAVIIESISYILLENTTYLLCAIENYLIPSMSSFIILHPLHVIAVKIS